MTSSIFKQVNMAQGLLDYEHDAYDSIVATVIKRYKDNPYRKGNLAVVWRQVEDESDGKVWVRSEAMWAGHCRIPRHRNPGCSENKSKPCRCGVRCRCFDSERRADRESIARARERKTLRVVAYSERKYCPQCAKHFEKISKSVPVECWWSVKGDKELDEQFAQAW